LTNIGIRLLLTSDEKSREVKRNAECRMLNFEPQKLAGHFDIHYSIFCSSAVIKVQK
jgi:hypothetical protein